MEKKISQITVLTSEDHLNMIQEAILCKMRQNRDAYELITNEYARNELQKEISEYNKILKSLCAKDKVIITYLNI